MRSSKPCMRSNSELAVHCEKFVYLFTRSALILIAFYSSSKCDFTVWDASATYQGFIWGI